MYNLHEQDAKVEEVSTSADWLGPNLEEWGGSVEELACARFAVYGNGDLHVIEIKDWHMLLAVPRVRHQPKATRKNSYHAGPMRETSVPPAGTKL
jgi:hypothetical protein